MWSIRNSQGKKISQKKFVLNGQYRKKGKWNRGEIRWKTRKWWNLYHNCFILFNKYYYLLKKGGLKYANVPIKQSELVNRTGYTTNDILNIIQDLIKDGLFERLKGKIGKSKFAKHKIGTSQ